jgi:hypothetical protein
MVGNALLRSGVQINFWPSERKRGRFASGADQSLGHLDFWSLQKKCTFELQSLVKLNG